MKKILTIAWVISLGAMIFVSCNPVAKNIAKPQGFRETPVVSGTEYCGAAEKHLKDMCAADPQVNMYCCQTAENTKKGKSFEQFCKETQNAGIMLNPKCLSEIISCGQIDICLGTKR